MITWPATRAAWAAELIKAATVLKPRGRGPFPVVFQFHGCGGLRPFQKAYAEAAVRAGVAAVIVDSFKPRGMSRLDASLLVCTGMTLHGAQRSADVFAMHHWAHEQDWIDKDRIVMAGWSHGGWTIMDAMALGDRASKFSRLSDVAGDPLKDIAGAILVYPYAGYPSMTTGRGWGTAKPKVACLLCGKDQVVGVRFPPKALDRLERDGVPVQRLLLPDATHAFDDEAASDPRARHRPDLLDQAKAWYATQLKWMTA